jgi:membrane-bound lytic murein transglycosylase D
MFMRFSLTAAILAFLVFVAAGNGICTQAKNSATPKVGIPTEQDFDREGELPDDPLSYQPDARTTHGEEKIEAGALPGAHVLTDKARKAFEAIRDALREATIPGDLDIPVVINDAVDRHIRCFTGTKREVFARWLVRSEKYAPTIREILRKNGLPEDLVYLSMIESGFNMKARSRAKASGPWQFMDGTGKQYGLRVDYWVDERYDLEKSTVAAARYLKDLFDRFGCWYLAAASYNAGENRVQRAIEQRDTKDFWELREYKTLPKETQEYVPQLIAAALIAKEPEKYGFTGIESVPVHTLSRVAVPGGVPLKTIARELSLDVADLRALNPEILKGITPPNRKEYQIKIPGTVGSDIAGRKLEASLADDRRVVDVVRHCVKKKESLTGILKRYDVSRSDLGLVNAEGLRAQRGHILYIPLFSSRQKNTTMAAGRSGSGVLVSDRHGPGDRAGVSGASDEDNTAVVLKHRVKNHEMRVSKARLAMQTVAKKAVKKNVTRVHAKTRAHVASHAPKRTPG